MLEQYIPHGPPEIPPVRGEGVLVIGFDIPFLGGLDVFQGLRGSFVIVERGQKPRLDADVQLLHLGCVQAEILPAQRTDTHQFHLPLENIDAHREFVQPGFPQHPPPYVHPVVIRELAALLQALMLQHVRLKVFGIGIHGPELVHADLFSLKPARDILPSNSTRL